VCFSKIKKKDILEIQKMAKKVLKTLGF